MSSDGTLRLLELTEQDEDGPPASRRPLRSGERMLTVRISGPSGAHVEGSVPASALPADCTARDLLLMVVDEAHNDFDGTSEELSRRRTLLQQLPDHLARVEPGARGSYVLMLHDDAVGCRAVHPDARVEVSDGRTHELHAHFVVAPYHTGGR